MPEQHFDTPRPVELAVQVEQGSVLVEAVETATSVVALAGPGADDVEVRHDGDRLHVVQHGRAGFGRDRTVEARITVPTGSAASVRTGSADVTLAGSSGRTEVRTGSGDVRADAFDAATLVETGSGDVTVRACSADVRLKSGSGEIRVERVDGEVAVSTGSGDVRLDLCSATAAVKTGSGDLLVEESTADLSLATGSGDLQVRRAMRGRVLVKAASGDVLVGVPDGLPVWTEISTVTGDVSSDLPAVGAPAEGQDHLELRATTVTGDVVLRRV